MTSRVYRLDKGLMIFVFPSANHALQKKVFQRPSDGGVQNILREAKIVHIDMNSVGLGGFICRSSR